VAADGAQKMKAVEAGDPHNLLPVGIKEAAN
jgi:hypothetical protein